MARLVAFIALSLMYLVVSSMAAPIGPGLDTEQEEVDFMPYVKAVFNYLRPRKGAGGGGARGGSSSSSSSGSGSSGSGSSSSGSGSGKTGGTGSGGSGSGSSGSGKTGGTGSGSSNSSSKKSKKHKLSSGAIAGITIGCIIVLLVVAAIVIVYGVLPRLRDRKSEMRRSQKQLQGHEMEDRHDSHSDFDNGVGAGYTNNGGDVNPTTQPPSSYQQNKKWGDYYPRR